MMRTLLFAVPVLLAGCVRPAAPPEPTPAPAPPLVARPLPPAPAPAPIAADWRDWPRAPGDWRYVRGSGVSTASYGAPGAVPVATIRCDAARRRVTLARTAPPASAITVRTSSTTRALPASPGAAGTVAAELAADDRLLDAMIYSRGRFTMEAPPAAPLALPAWAEVARVVEDCRG